MNKETQKKLQKVRRKARINVKGTAGKPRLSVSRSLKSIGAQLIDDTTHKTIVSANSKEVKDKLNKVDTAKEVGRILAKKAVEKKITKVVFDRGYNKYHGRVKALAEGAREGGLEF